MRFEVAIIAPERQTLLCRATLLADGRSEVVASVVDLRDLRCGAQVAVVFCAAPDPAALIAQASLMLPASRLVTVLPVVTRHTVRRSIRAGAAAVVAESNLAATLPSAVHSACAGQLSIPLDFADGLEKPILSSREKQILGMVVMGFTNGQIARRLYLAESTVKSHMSSIFGKLGVGSRKEAAALVLDPEEGLGLGILAISDDPIAADMLAGPREVTAA